MKYVRYKARMIRAFIGLGLVVSLLVMLTGCWPFNTSPVAYFTASPLSGPAPLSVAFSAMLSEDPDGFILKWEWDFGDGESGVGESISHTYDTPGTYDVTLRVTDDDSATATASRTITVTAAEEPGGAGAGPTASFTATPLVGAAPLSVTFNASASAYAGHAITYYSWDFGDGVTGTGMTTTHTYAPLVTTTYNVVLRIIAADNTEDTATKSITATVIPPTPPANAPTASFTSAPNKAVAPQQFDFDPANSKAVTPAVLQHFLWVFGDGTTPQAENDDVHVFHRYVTSQATEQFVVALTVGDNQGAYDTETRTVTVENYLPTAGFRIYDVLGLNGGGFPGSGNWQTDDVTFNNVQTTSTTVWIESTKVPDAWIGDSTVPGDPAPQGSASSQPIGYADRNRCFDPEGQGWDDNVGGYVATDDVPAGWPNAAWGIERIEINWGDGTTTYHDYYNDVMNGTGEFYHAYVFTGGILTRTITMTAKDFLGGSNSFSRDITLNSS